MPSSVLRLREPSKSMRELDRKLLTLPGIGDGEQSREASFVEGDEYNVDLKLSCGLSTVSRLDGNRSRGSSTVLRLGGKLDLKLGLCLLHPFKGLYAFNGNG